MATCSSDAIETNWGGDETKRRNHAGAAQQEPLEQTAFHYGPPRKSWNLGLGVRSYRLDSLDRLEGEMTRTPELHKVHRQRIATAVEALQSGRTVTLQVTGTSAQAFICWIDGSTHIIAAGSGRQMEALLPLVQKDFARQVTEGIRDLGESDDIAARA